jgi:hypothetical protein
MKVKFLKKVRKRYRWFWHEAHNKWYLLDFKKKDRELFYTTWAMLLYIITELKGYGLSNYYLTKIKKKEKMKSFRAICKEYESKKH